MEAILCELEELLLANLNLSALQGFRREIIRFRSKCLAVYANRAFVDKTTCGRNALCGARVNDDLAK